MTQIISLTDQLTSCNIKLLIITLLFQHKSKLIFIALLLFLRRRRRREEGLWRRLRATGEGKSEVEDGDGLSSSVKDMERYLDELSIEYDSVWDTKPAWCQPWTIALTGVIGISASWLLLHSIVLTAVVSVLVSAWWFLFLYSYPLAYAQMIAQRRKDQKDGLEDTFGTRQRSN
ncbi:unnamed protein product [Sphagnum troendelagicum]|uniref:DUF6737 domain-containing protein n=1 Tax=Sphagnum troendelagicum TaxID=128251 RepID=A0ABP0U490_9BRYO